MALSKNTLVSEAWNQFYTRLNANVTTITGLSVTMPNGTNSATIQSVTSSYSDKQINSKTNYPFIIVEPPTLSTEQRAMKTDRVDYSITIEVYANQAEVADKFIDEVMKSIETYRGTFSDNGIHNLNIESTDHDMAERDSLKIHVRSVTYSFYFVFSKTGAY